MSKLTTFMTRYDLEVAASWIHRTDDVPWDVALAYLTKQPTQQLLQLVESTIQGFDSAICILPLSRKTIKPSSETECFKEVQGYVCMLCGIKILAKPGCVQIVCTHSKSKHAEFLDEFGEYKATDIFMAFGIPTKNYMLDYLSTKPVTSTPSTPSLPLWDEWNDWSYEVVTQLTCPISRQP